MSERKLSLRLNSRDSKEEGDVLQILSAKKNTVNKKHSGGWISPPITPKVDLPFELKSHELLLKIDNKLLYKFLRPIKKMFNYRSNTHARLEACNSCNKRFGWLLGKKKVICSRCSLNFCPKCLAFQLSIDATAISGPSFEEMLQSFGSNSRFNTAKQTLGFKLCETCFQAICGIFKRFLEIYNRRRTSAKEITGNMIFQSFSLENTPNLITDFSNPVPYENEELEDQLFSYEDLDSQKVSRDGIHYESPLRSFIEYSKAEFGGDIGDILLKKFISKIDRISISRSIKSGLALENYIKIYDLTTADNTSDKALDLLTVKGTLIKRLIRHKKFASEEYVPNVLLLSLPINFSFQLSKPLHNGSEQLSLLSKEEGNKEENILHRQKIAGITNLLGNVDINDNQFSSKEESRKNDNTSMADLFQSQINDTYIPLEKLTQLKSKIHASILDIVKRGGVKLLFCTEAIPHSLFDQLRKNGVISIFPVSLKEMKILSQTVNAEIIENSSLLCSLERENTSLTKYIGTATHFKYWERYVSSKNISHIILVENAEDEADRESSWKNMGLLVLGNNEKKNSDLCKFLRSNLKHVYYLLMEREIIETERKMITNHKGDTIKINSQGVGNFEQTIVGHVSLTRLLRCNNQLLFTKVSLVRMSKELTYNDFVKYYDHLAKGFNNFLIKKLKTEDIFPEEFDYFKRDLDKGDLRAFNNLNLSKIDFLSFFCCPPVRSLEEPFGECDVTLEGFIKYKMMQAQEICSNKCKRAHTDHVTMYYLGNSCVKIILEELEAHDGLSQTSMNMTEKFSPVIRRGTGVNDGYLRTNFIEESEIPKIDASKESLTKPSKGFSFKKFMFSRFGRGFSRETETTHKEQDQLKTFICCSLCSEILTKVVTIPEKMKNMSFLMYIYAMQATNPELLNTSIDKRVDIVKDPRVKCSHHSHSRCFSFKQKVLKICRNNLTVFNLSHSDLKSTKKGMYDIFRKKYLAKAMIETNASLLTLAEYTSNQAILLTLINKEVINSIASTGQRSKPPNLFENLCAVQIELITILLELSDSLLDSTQIEKSDENYTIKIFSLISRYNNVVDKLNSDITGAERMRNNTSVISTIHHLLDLVLEESGAQTLSLRKANSTVTVQETRGNTITEIPALQSIRSDERSTIDLIPKGNDEISESIILLPSSGEKTSFLNNTDTFSLNRSTNHPLAILKGLNPSCLKDPMMASHGYCTFQHGNQLSIYATVLGSVEYISQQISQYSHYINLIHDWIDGIVSGSVMEKKISILLKDLNDRTEKLEKKDKGFRQPSHRFNGLFSTLKKDIWSPPILNVNWGSDVRTSSNAANNAIIRSGILNPVFESQNAKLLNEFISMKKSNLQEPTIEQKKLFPDNVPVADLYKLRNILSSEHMLRIDDYKKRLFVAEDLKFEMYIHYPIHFEIVRELCGYEFEEYAISNLVAQGFETSGGATKSEFLKTKDERFVAKSIEQVEFEDFHNFLPNYTKYILKVQSQKLDSVLARIFGLFEIKTSSDSKPRYWIIMENIFYGLESSNIKVYDLKGSQAKRMDEKPDPGVTLKDTNFQIERNCDPLAFVSPHLRFFKALENDSNFLKKNNVIDYSLLLVMGVDKKIIRVGIIDYLREYDFKKMLEQKYKELINLGKAPTIVEPQHYADRFTTMMNQYFVEVDPNNYLYQDNEIDGIYQYEGVQGKMKLEKSEIIE